MKITLLLLFIILIVILIFVSMQHNKEGFFDRDSEQASFVKDRLTEYNDIGISLTAASKVGVLGRTANDILQTTGENKQYPLATKDTGIAAIIKTCEAIKTMDCGAFDNRAFATNCGMCLDMGKGSDGVPKTGGLVLLPDDRQNVPKAYRDSIPDYTATIGFCPAAKMVSTKEECLKLQRKLLCEKNSSYDLPGCSQCQSDQNYTIVDPETSPGILAGSGTIKFTGNGSVRIQETGGAASSNITLSSTPQEYNIQGPESTNIKFFLTGSAGQNAWLAGTLVGPVTTGTFTTDLRQIVLADEVTGRKPRSSGMVRINGENATKMSPGFGQTTATIIVIIPFSFTDLGMEESSLCKDAPFITKKSSATFLGSDPCYIKGSGPGKFSLECLQGAWLANGCTESGKAYPVDTVTAANLMTDEDGKFRTLNDISDYIYNNAIITSTGIDENGVTQSMKKWSDASVFCTGREITSPCDTPNKASGPLSPDCIVYLWKNQGSKKLWNGKSDPIGPTYYTSLAKSLFGIGPVERSCQEAGTLSPVNPDGSKTGNIAYWQGKGGLDAVKSAMADLHRAANAQAAADDTLAPYFKQCYGNITFAARPEPVFECSTNLLPTSFTPSRGNVLANNITMTQDYQLDFDITPTATINDWANILHFTTGDNISKFGSRAPGLWFWPGTLNLYLIIGDSDNKDFVVGNGQLQGCSLNTKTHISIKCNATSIKVTIGTQSYTAVQPTYRYSGSLMVYGGDPWHGVPPASVTNLCLKLNGNTTSVGPMPINIGNSGTNVKIVPLPKGIPDSWNNIKIVSQGYSDDFVFRKEGSNLVVTRVDNYSGWGASYSATIQSGEFPSIANVGFVRIEGGSLVLNLSQLVVLNEKGQNISKGRAQQVNSETFGDANKTKPNDGGEAPRGHPSEYHGQDGGKDLWQVMLDGSNKVSSVIIYNRGDCCQDRMGSGYVIKMYSPLPSPKLLFVSNVLTSAPVQIVRTVDNNTGEKQVGGNNGSVSCETYCNGTGSGPWGGELPREWNGARCNGSLNPDVGCNSVPGVRNGFVCKCEKTGKGWK